MNPNNIAYKNQIKKLGAVLLIMLGAITAASLVFVVFELVGEAIGPSVAFDVIYSLSYSILYFLMFFIPLLFYKKFDKEYRFSSMPCKFKFSRYFPLLLLAGLAINYVAAYMNSMAVSLIGFDISSLGTDSYPNGYHGYHFVLETIQLAIVPAFCEELLFRGLICDRLSRFGREKAIFISALTFALMHQNPAQIFYTFILGLFLGFVFFETGSIWGGIILHFVNNFTQVIISALLYTQHEQRATFIISIIELCVVVAGTAAAIYYMCRHSKKTLGDPDWLFYADNELSARYSVKGFFTPTMIIYCVIAIASAFGLMFI